MCGITGYIAGDKLPLNEMVKSLQHRGPNAVGFYETAINDKQIGLGHIVHQVEGVGLLGKDICAFRCDCQNAEQTYHMESRPFQYSRVRLTMAPTSTSRW